MGDTNWIAVAAGDGKASTNTNWSANAPNASTRAVFSNGGDIEDCDWDISGDVDGISVDSTYTGTISLSTAMNMTGSVALSFGGANSTITTNDNDVTLDVSSGYYCNVAGIINWGDSTVDITGAFNGTATMNFGAADVTVSSDWRAGNSTINITGDTTINAGQSGGGTWNMNGASPTITITRPYNQTIQIDDPGTSTWIWKLTSNDSDTWNLGSGSFYNFETDFSAAPSIRTGSFGAKMPAGPLDFPMRCDGNLKIFGGVLEFTSYTKLMLHCDGVEGGTTFNDSSGRLHTITVLSDAETKDGEKKFGTASLWLGGSGDGLSAAANGDWDFDTGDFTIDLWVRTTDATAANQTIMSSQNYYTAGYNGNWILRRTDSDTIAWASYDGTGTEVYNEFTAATSVNTWYHIALVRDGTDIELFVDGVSKGTVTDSKDLLDGGASGIYIAKAGTNNIDWEGYMDEIRISKGVARWDAAFTPETSAYDFVPSLSVGNDLFIADDSGGTRSGTCDLTSGSMELKAGLDNNTGGILEGAEGWTRIGGQWSNGPGVFNHNNGTVYLAGNYNKDWGPYNLIACNRFWESPYAYVWKNESTPFIYVQSTLTVENEFTISGTYVRMQNYSPNIVGGNMVVGVEGGGTAAASGSGWCFDGNNQVQTLTVSGNMDVWEDAYVGNSGYDYGGARGVGTIGANNERRGTLIVEGYVGVWGDMAANSGSSAGNGNYWDFGCLHIGDGVVYAPQASGTGSDAVESPIYVGAYGNKGRNHTQDVYNNTGSGRFHHNSGTLKNHNDNQTTRIYGGDYTNGPLWNYSLKALNLGNGHFVYDAGEDWVIQNDLTVDSALFYPLTDGIVGGDVLCQDSTGGGVTFFDNAWAVTVSGNFTMNKGAGLARFRNPTINLYGNFINNGGTWY